MPQGGRVVIWAPNSPSLVATLFGAFIAQSIVVPLDPYSTLEFVEATLEGH